MYLQRFINYLFARSPTLFLTSAYPGPKRMRKSGNWNEGMKVCERERLMRERENEMGVKGNEIEEYFLHLNQEPPPPPPPPKKKKPRGHLRSVVKDKTSFFLSCSGL